MNEKLNEVPKLEQSDLLKEKVFAGLLGCKGHGRVRNMGVGPSPCDFFGSRSSSTNIYFLDAIQRMIQSQVETQLEVRVSEKVEKHVAEKVSHNEKVQTEMYEKMDTMYRLLVREGLLEPSRLHDTPRSGSSVEQVQTTSNES